MPRPACFIFLLYVLINGGGAFKHILVLYLGSLGWTAAATGEALAGSVLMAVAYLLLTQLLLHHLSVHACIALLALAQAAVSGTIAAGTELQSGTGVAVGVLGGVPLGSALALIRARVVELVPAQAGAALFILAIVDQLSTLGGQLGFSTIFAYTATSWPALSAWVPVFMALACVPCTLGLGHATTHRAMGGSDIASVKVERPPVLL